MDSDKTLSDLSPRQIGGLVLLMLLAIVAKVMPYLLYRWGFDLDPEEFGSYVWNFSPLMPLAIVAGSSLKAHWAYGLPLLTWFLGDLGIWAASGHFEWAFYAHQPVIYELIAGLAFLGVCGRALMRSQSWLERTSVNLGAGLIGATLFFLISNFMTWAFAFEMMYPSTLAGLMECYAAGVPFFRCSLWSMVVYIPILTALMPAPQTAMAQGEVENPLRVGATGEA